MKKQKLLYQGLEMRDCQGHFLCYCDSKRANWYIKRQLAHWVSDGVFQLTFMTASENVHPYYKQRLSNQCVVCGVDSDLNKHHVVPHMFRKHLPSHYKEFQHHDVLSVCESCHERYERHADVLKSDLLKKFTPSAEDVRRFNAYKKACHMIEKIKNEPQLKKHIEHEKYQKWIMLSQSIVEPPPDPSYACVAAMLQNSVVDDFVRLWRQHFIDYAQPNFLPPLWCVDHPVSLS